jgi:ketosteroid isomerase-like protein
MTTNEKQIRDLIERWIAAIHAGDLEAVVADHADDIVMFDVPPPDQGVRGMAAYRETWPGFFEYVRHGAAFELKELTVVDGADVAFAYALLNCGQPDEMGSKALRLTLGLRREGDRWIVVHEHHSFPDESFAAQDDIRAIHDGWAEATETKNLDGMMASISDDIVSYEHQTPLEYVGIDKVRESCREGLEYGTGRTTFTVPELTVRVDGHLAVAWGLNRMTSEDADGTEQEMWSRGTRVFERRGGKWLMTHQHVSFPTPDGRPPVS